MKFLFFEITNQHFYEINYSHNLIHQYEGQISWKRKENEIELINIK